MSKEIFDRGLAIRKKVLGAEFVEKSFASADDFNRPMQELTTEYCWRAVWGRDAAQNPQHAQSRDDQLLEPAARTKNACQRRPQERRNQGRDPRGFPPGRHLCGNTGWGRLVPHRSRGVRRNRERRLSPRFVPARRVTELVVFLCGPVAKDMTGAILPVEAGWLAS